MNGWDFLGMVTSWSLAVIVFVLAVIIVWSIIAKFVGDWMDRRRADDDESTTSILHGRKDDD